MSNPIAFVLMEDPVKPNSPALVDALRQRHPERAWDVAGGTANPVDSPLIRCGDQIVAIMSVPAPLPHDEGLWTRASMSWPEARATAGRHRAHVVVSLMGTSESKVESARITTAVVGGLVAVTPGCSAVVWRTEVARSASMWLDMARGAFAPFPNYPFMLWVDIVPFQSGQTIGAVTVGLSSFVDREIEFEVGGMKGPDIIKRVAGLASYLIEHGAVIKDGDTVGESESDRSKVHYRASRFNGSPVLAVGTDHPAPAPNPSKQYPIISPATARAHPLLIMLGRAGLFDPSGPENEVQLRPDEFVSEVRLESYDAGFTGWLSNILATDAYAAADEKARRALAASDVELAKSVLMPFAQQVKQFQATARNALAQKKLFLFQPK